MVLDTLTESKVFHEDKDKVIKHYDEAVLMIEEHDETGEYNVSLFEVVKQKTIEIEN